VETIVRRLRDKKATTVFATNLDEFGTNSNGIITHPGTHFITFVGCSGDGRSFLVADPWPTGSMMTYTSGIFGNVHLIFMGLMFFRPEEHRLSRDALDGVKVVEGVHRYVVIEGP
jgi:hypothetical protein